MSYANINAYEVLYARYREHPVSDLIDLAGDVKDKVVWDLCCGGGALSGECIRRGAAKVIAVDKCGDMTSRLKYAAQNTGCWDGRFRLEIAEVQNYIPVSIAPTPDFVFCRQAVNYWLNDRAARDLASQMGKGSVFVFNTFNRKPPEKPIAKEYEYEGHNFVEVSWLALPDVVHHVQIRQDMPPHITAFRWIPQSEFIRMLGSAYDVEVKERGAASLYRCVRK
jgi:SAM-dependent methyltransferase